MSQTAFAVRLAEAVERYRAEIAGPREHLSLLRWQIAEGHALDSRDCFPGHVTTSAYVLSPDHARILLIDHVVIGRWLQPGGHWEDAATFAESAAREALEETGVQGLRLHPWHRGSDIPFVIDSHDVPGKPRAASRPISITTCNISSWPIRRRRSSRRSRRSMPPPGSLSPNSPTSPRSASRGSAA